MHDENSARALDHGYTPRTCMMKILPKLWIMAILPEHEWWKFCQSFGSWLYSQNLHDHSAGILDDGYTPGICMMTILPEIWILALLPELAWWLFCQSSFGWWLYSQNLHDSQNIVNGYAPKICMMAILQECWMMALLLEFAWWPFYKNVGWWLYS